MSKPSMMFSISSATKPCVLGGISMHVVAAIGGADRFDPVGLVIGEVAHVEQAVRAP